jgi:hypothetical protein
MTQPLLRGVETALRFHVTSAEQVARRSQRRTHAASSRRFGFGLACGAGSGGAAGTRALVLEDERRARGAASCCEPRVATAARSVPRRPAQTAAPKQEAVRPRVVAVLALEAAS